MSQITTGVRAILSSPRVYDTFQRLMGGHVGRTDFASTMIRAASGTRVLDVGCGTGDLLAYLPTGVTYHGWDISEAYISSARARFGTRGAFHAGLLREADVDREAPYDIVIASGVLHHLDDAEVVAFARLARRAVRDGGRFVSIDPVFEPGQHPVARALIARDRGQHVPHERRLRGAGAVGVPGGERSRAPSCVGAVHALDDGSHPASAHALIGRQRRS